jgi:hypothetical protein
MSRRFSTKLQTYDAGFDAWLVQVENQLTGEHALKDLRSKRYDLRRLYQLGEHPAEAARLIKQGKI